MGVLFHRRSRYTFHNIT